MWKVRIMLSFNSQGRLAIEVAQMPGWARYCFGGAAGDCAGEGRKVVMCFRVEGRGEVSTRRSVSRLLLSYEVEVVRPCRSERLKAWE